MKFVANEQPNWPNLEASTPDDATSYFNHPLDKENSQSKLIQ